MAGGSGPMTKAIAQIDAANRSSSSSSSNGPTPGYIAPSQLAQASAYQPAQTAQIQQMSPLVQQIMMRSMAPQPMMGLPAALMQMQGRLNQPIMRGPMPQYGSQGNPMAYRPDMTQTQARLNNVAKSVILQQKEAAEAELARMKEAEEARLAQEQRPGLTSFND